MKRRQWKLRAWAILLSSATLSLTVNAAADADSAFEALLDKHWAAQLAQNPTFATSLGERQYDHLLGDPSLEAYDRDVAQAKAFTQQLATIDASQLSAAHKVNYALLKLDLETEIEASEHGGKYMIITNRGGPHMNLTQLPARLPFFTTADYQSYVTRLTAMPEYLQRATSRVRAGLDAGWVQPCVTMQGYEKSISAHLPDNLEDSVFLDPFDSQPSVISDAEFKRLRDQAAQTIKNAVLPAMQQYAKFYNEEYAPKCRNEVGTDSMPGGKTYYEHRVKRFTTTDRSADEVHQIGLAEVARIKAEMMAVIREAEFKGSFDDWLVYLRDNPDFYPKTAEERMQVAAAISKKIDGELPKLFGKLPRMPYGLKEIPLDIAEKTTTAYYSRPAGDGSRAGFYYVNTTLLETRPLYQLEALTLHEAVPGHHLQIALAQELDLPEFRRYGGQTVFVEGWALYAERLGLETGFYQTPYTNFGRLSYEMWRACRLVVDTGIHAFGWTRDEAVSFMEENTSLSIHEINTEIDRYISWPGQALAYKTGEMKIRELRSKAERELGDLFDIRQFHEVILEIGTVTLPILEERVNKYIISSK